MGITRLNIYAGLAGLYVLRDMKDPIAPFLPARENEIPLNVSYARFYPLQLSNQQKFIQIGSDGGYLPQPVELSSLLLSPASRYPY